jgi:hypothetical protein
MENFSLSGIVQVIAVGVPAMLILLGFFAYVGGLSVEWITGNKGMQGFGVTLIVFGIVFYILEFVVAVVSNYQGSNY